MTGRPRGLANQRCRSRVFNLGGSPLRVDSGDAELDRLLEGYVRVVTGYRSSCFCRICA